MEGEGGGVVEDRRPPYALPPPRLWSIARGSGGEGAKSTPTTAGAPTAIAGVSSTETSPARPHPKSMTRVVVASSSSSPSSSSSSSPSSSSPLSSYSSPSIGSVMTDALHLEAGASNDGEDIFQSRCPSCLSIEVLPEELIAHVLHFLGPLDLLASAAVCRQWRRLADSSPKWRYLAVSRWPPTTCDIGNYGGSWKALFLDRNRCGRMGTFRWEIAGFRRKRAREKITSPCFQVGGCTWRLECYPGGLIRDQMGDGGTLSLFLRHIVDPTKEMATEDSSKGQPIFKNGTLPAHSHSADDDDDDEDDEFENDDVRDGSARTTRSRSHNSKHSGEWARIVAFNIFIVNSLNKRLTIGKRSINEFHKNEEWGWGDFVGMSKLDEPGFVVSNRPADDHLADSDREKAAALEDIKESPPDESGTLTIETFVVVSDPSEDKVTVEELLRTYISGVFSNNLALQGVCLGKMDELLQMHSSPTSILGSLGEESHPYQHEAEGKKMMLDPCPNSKLRVIIRSRGCINKILALLQDSTQDIELRVSAAGILQTLAFNDYNDDKAIIDAGGVPILLAALAPESKGENKRTRVDLQVCAAGTLLNLQLCKESSHIVLKEGGVAICVELLRTHTDIDLLQEVAGVIANAAVCEEEGAVIVSRLGGIGPLMKHLQPGEDVDEHNTDEAASGRYTNVYPRPSDSHTMDPTVLQLNSAIALQFTIRNSPSDFGAKDTSAYVPMLKKMWKHASIVQKCCAGIILVELSFFLSPGSKFVTKRDIAWLLSLINSNDIDEGVLLGVLKLIGGLCETNYGKARKWIRASDGVNALLKLICATDSQNAQWFAAHTLNGLSLFDYAGAKRIAECAAVELPEPGVELLVEPGRDAKERRTLSSLEILIRLLKSNNGGPRVAACDALSNLVLNYPPCRDALRNLGLIKLVRDIMESSTHATLQFIAASTLSCLVGSRASTVTLNSSTTHSFTFPSTSYLSASGAGSFSLPFSFLMSSKDNGSNPPSPPSSSSPSYSAPASPKQRTNSPAEEDCSDNLEEKQRSTRERKLASFFSSPSFFPVARPRSPSILDKDERQRDHIGPPSDEGQQRNLSSSQSYTHPMRRSDGTNEVSDSDALQRRQQHSKADRPEASPTAKKKGKTIADSEASTNSTGDSATREKSKYQLLRFRRGTFYSHELDLMRGNKGLHGMLHELVHTKNREVQFQAIKGIGTLGSMDEECLDVILTEDDGRAILRLGQFLECTNFMLLRVAAFSLYCLCSTHKAGEVTRLIVRYRIVPLLKTVASYARDAVAKTLAKKTLKLVKKHRSRP